MSDTSLSWSSPEFLFRIICTVQALAQLFAYSIVTIYALEIGPIDFLLPIRIGFGITVASSVIFPIIDLNRLRVNPRAKWGEFGFNAYHLVFEGIAIFALATFATFFIPHNYSAVDLRSQTPDAKWIVAAGVALLASFTFFAIGDLLALKRKGGLPRFQGEGST